MNEYLHAAAGDSFTAKDFRTWYATVAALEALRELPVGNQREIKRQLNKVISDVAARLGNTPTICRKCYIHPEVLLGYTQGRLAALPRTSITNALKSLLGKRKRSSSR